MVPPDDPSASTPEKVAVPRATPKPVKVREHPKKKVKKGFVTRHFRKKPKKKRQKVRPVYIPSDPRFPESTGKNVLTTYSFEYVRQNPQVLEGITPPDQRFLRVDRKKNWFRFRMQEPSEFHPQTYSSLKPSPDTLIIRAVSRKTGKYETQAIVKRSPTPFPPNYEVPVNDHKE